MSVAPTLREPRAPVGPARLLAGLQPAVPLTLREHLERFGRLPRRSDLIDRLDDAGLRGRGGAAFPVATKLRSVALRRGGAVVVANGVEGEPASGKDKVLLRLAPHLVLDGVVAAAQAVGAREGVVAISASAHTEHEMVRRAIVERGREQVVLRVAAVAGGFVSGEETAVLQALGGGRPKPTLKPPYPFERGLGGAPTLVQNVETLAHLGLIARFGPEWFRSAGADDAPGTALVTLGGAFVRPGVHEIELGSSLADLIGRAGGPTEPLAGILVGGYFGRWVPADAALRLTPEVLGAGAVIALPADACPLAECSRVVRYLADESAGQCGPCVNGLAAIAGAFERLTEGDRDAHQQARAQLGRWTEQVRGRGACRHPDGVVGFVDSALTVFADDLDRHARRKRCGRRLRGVLPVPTRKR